jgi:HK97 family phage prohead protease
VIVGFDTEASQLAFEVDREARTITGLAVPYGVPSATKNGHRYQFSKGSLVLPAEMKRVKLLVSHDRSLATGYLKEFNDRPDGLWVKFSVARGPEGDRALQMAEDGVWDGLSIGLRDGGQFSRKGGIQHSISNEIAEISLTPDPAFSDARVSAVAAEADEGSPQVGDTEETVESPQVAPQFDMDALVAALGEKFEITPKSEREVIAPATGRTFDEVNEELPYRFDRGGNLVEGKFDFSTDLYKGLAGGDKTAYDRALNFARLQFDVDSADATALNPQPTRADLYVDQRQYKYPLYEATRAGTLRDKTPFVIPKFNTATGLVAAHTEGVEPTPGTFTATSATVTPGAVSGKVEITRELWDQGGSPQVSGLIWRQMERAYYEALEAKVVAVLDAATPTAIALTAGGGTTGQTLSSELAAAIASLQFIRGGFAFDTMATQIDLYKALVAAKDNDGRPLFPILAPSNANGQATPRYAGLNVHGVAATPSWALAASGSVVASSYLFDRESVRTWASAPERLEFQYRVAYVDLAIWGYSVSAILDTTGVREITYDNVP